jgi:hypothetical protein
LKKPSKKERTVVAFGARVARLLEGVGDRATFEFCLSTFSREFFGNDPFGEECLRWTAAVREARETRPAASPAPLSAPALASVK